VLRNVESRARRTSVLLTFTRGSRSASWRRGNGDGAESSGGRLGFRATAAEGGAARVLGEEGVRNRGKAATFIGGEEAPGHGPAALRTRAGRPARERVLPPSDSDSMSGMTGGVRPSATAARQLRVGPLLGRKRLLGLAAGVCVRPHRKA
jgi:hypothetical protein